MENEDLTLFPPVNVIHTHTPHPISFTSSHHPILQIWLYRKTSIVVMMLKYLEVNYMR